MTIQSPGDTTTHGTAKCPGEDGPGGPIELAGVLAVAREVAAQRRGLDTIRMTPTTGPVLAGTA